MTNPADQPFFSSSEAFVEQEQKLLRERRGKSSDAPWLGLALSGGGIRSATFCLGALQALAARDLLRKFDYISSVSGGGYIACEFASIFNGLGSDVTQLYRGHQVLRGFDEEVRAFIAGEMAKTGVTIRLNNDVAAIERKGEALEVKLIDGSHITVDTVLYATGRVPLVQGIGLEAAGIKQNAVGAIEVNEKYQTSVPSVYAVGDVTARVQLTPVALAEAMVVVDELFSPTDGKLPRSMSYDFIPTAVFTHPNIGTVGYSQAAAAEKFGKITVYRSNFKALKHTLSGSTERTLMKLIVEDATDRVVGLHMVGADAGEIVQGFAVAMKAGATKAIFDSTIGIHPTMAEEFVTMREPVK